MADNDRCVMEGKIRRIVPESGAIERCPECGRVLVNDHCVVHLEVEPVKDLRVKGELEDGATVVFGAEKVEDLLGLTVDEIHALPEHDAVTLVRKTFKEQDIEVVVDPIKEEDRIYRVTRVNSFG